MGEARRQHLAGGSRADDRSQRTQLRIYHALVLLADGRDITQTAYACGWANPSSFIAAFTNILGTTPGRYQTSRQNTARVSQPIAPRRPNRYSPSPATSRQGLHPQLIRPDQKLS
ncbi:MAG: helix-turn-helix domain-containing protein [Trebonia sp.]